MSGDTDSTPKLIARKPRGAQRREQPVVQAIEACLALEPQVEVPRANLVRQRHRALAIVREERVPEDDVGSAELVAQRFELVDDVPDGAGTVSGENAMRTIRAELRAAAAREQRDAAAERTRSERERPAARPVRREVPSRKRQRVEIGNLAAHAVSLERLSARHPLDRRFRLSEHQEVRVRPEQLRQLRHRQPDEPDACSARANPIRPRRFVPIVDERAEDDRDVGVSEFSARPPDVVAVLREDARQIGEVHARNVVHPPLETSDHLSHTGKGLQSRTVAADDGVFRHDAISGGQIHQQNTHEVYPPARTETHDGRFVRNGRGGATRNAERRMLEERDRNGWFVERRRGTSERTGRAG